MIGARIGPRIGPRIGARIGLVSPDSGSVNPMAGVAQDATSAKYMPASSAQWTTTMAAAALASGNPAALWLLSALAAGNAPDAIGAFTLTANAAPLYQQAVPGWTAKAVATADGTPNQGFFSTAVGLPDQATTSQLALGYILVPAAPAGTRGLMMMGTSSVEARLTATPRYRCQGVGNNADGTNDPTGVVRPVVLKMDVTHAACTLYTDQEKMTAVFSANAGKEMAIGGFNAASAGASYLYATMFTGSAAELSDANVKSLLQILGWTIPWS